MITQQVVLLVGFGFLCSPGFRIIASLIINYSIENARNELNPITINKQKGIEISDILQASVAVFTASIEGSHMKKLKGDLIRIKGFLHVL